VLFCALATLSASNHSGTFPDEINARGLLLRVLGPRAAHRWPSKLPRRTSPGSPGNPCWAL